MSCHLPDKTEKVACITSNNKMLLGHEFRRKFLHELKEHMHIDVFGRGIREFDCNGIFFHRAATLLF